MFRVGLTGGIASGKTTISDHFKTLGVPVIDTDLISHELMQTDHRGYEKTLAHFGEKVLNADRTINRAILRDIVFNTPDEKIWLENMLHPLIRQSAEQSFDKLKNSDYVLLVVPLMFETDFNQLVDHVVAIDCPALIQKQRLMFREQGKNQSGVTFDENIAEKMISAQLSNQERINFADSVLKNTDNLDRSMDVKKLHEYLLNLAQSKQY